MSGFSFDGTHSSDMGLFVRSVDRTLLPAKRVVQYVIPGKSGTYDVDNGYEKRTIVCEIGFVGDNRNRADLRIKARQVAQWLAGYGQLVFDDEPDKGYTAEVVSAVSVEEVAATGKASVTFSCQPFAEALQYSLEHSGNILLPNSMNVIVSGSYECNPLIYIKANDTISGIKISRRTTF